MFVNLQSEGQTALHIASAEGDETLVKYFYGVRASASIIDNQGEWYITDFTKVFPQTRPPKCWVYECVSTDDTLLEGGGDYVEQGLRYIK